MGSYKVPADVGYDRQCQEQDSGIKYNRRCLCNQPREPQVAGGLSGEEQDAVAV